MPRPDLASPAWPRRTHRLVLRPLTSDDVEAVLSHRSLPEVVTDLSHGALDDNTWALLRDEWRG